MVENTGVATYRKRTQKDYSLAFKMHYSDKMGYPAKPCVATELLSFRKRIGKAGTELILKESIRVNEPPDEGAPKVISVDKRVQGKISLRTRYLRRQP